MTNDEKVNEILQRASLNHDSVFLGMKVYLYEILKWKEDQLKEETELIIEWFNHIAQIADDKKHLME